MDCDFLLRGKNSVSTRTTSLRNTTVWNWVLTRRGGFLDEQQARAFPRAALAVAALPLFSPFSTLGLRPGRLLPSNLLQGLHLNPTQVWCCSQTTGLRLHRSLHQQLGLRRSLRLFPRSVAGAFRLADRMCRHGNLYGFDVAAFRSGRRSVSLRLCRLLLSNLLQSFDANLLGSFLGIGVDLSCWDKMLAWQSASLIFSLSHCFSSAHITIKNITVSTLCIDCRCCK